ncbi:MAG TPA: AmmeMemoRadiSam system protein B [Syntrophorhabdaceae bacterium]|nr:AmmeMemoRadiSam system protein B [Syntrophorhabdaceae bacterium]HPU30602.1 AmmeMemoRadiSam system protein B [Syntrophorhabdaceae bacterium]
MGYIRDAVVSGSFYPSNPGLLKKEIEDYIKNAKVEEVTGNIVGMISPHAGYMYSGQVAAYGYKGVSKFKYNTVIIFAPSHRVYIDGASIMDKGAYRTPLGTVEIDEEIAEKILKKGDIVKNNIEPHRYEHSLEVQLPFLQVVLKDFKLIPIVIGGEIELCEPISSIVYEAIKDSKKSFLIVGSTDLSHYYPYKKAVALDGIAVKHLNAFDIKGAIDDYKKGSFEACGIAPMITTMYLSRMLGASNAKVLKYANSGDVTGDKSGVVGYVSAIFFKAI